MKEETWSTLFLLFLRPFWRWKNTFGEKISTAKVLTRACIKVRVNLEAVFFSSYLVHKRGIMDSWSQAFLEETVETGDKNRNMTDNITLFRAP